MTQHSQHMTIDAHTHVGPFIKGRPRVDPASISVDYDLWTKILSQNEIDKAVILPTTGYDLSEGIESTKKLNNRVNELVEEYDRFVTGIGTVEPTHQRRAIEELERLASLENISGVMWHHRHQGSSIDDGTTKECLARLDELDMVAYVHSFPESDLEEIDKIKKIAPYTDQPLIVLDVLGGYSNIEPVIEIANEFNNVYFDTALLFSLGMIIERLVEEIGAERLVFGSDLYTDPLMYRYSPDLYQIKKSDISDKERNKILSQNIKEILGI